MLDFLGTILDYINPFSENFILKGVLDFLGTILDYINPFSENFFGKQIVNAIGDLLKAIFVPDENSINNLIGSVTDKFRFIDNIKSTIENIKIMFSDVSTLPKLSVPIPENKWLSGSLVILDLSWYAPYKQYGDLIISAFIYIFFVWRTFVHLPSIITGTGGGIDDVYVAEKKVEKK